MTAEQPRRPRDGITPFLTIADGRAREAVDFYAKAFGAEVTETHPTPDGSKLMQAGLFLNGGFVMLSDDFPEFRGGQAAPPPAAVIMHLQVADADRTWERALAAGATVAMPLGDQFWGDRYGQLTDPFGHRWSIGGPIPKGAA